MIGLIISILLFNFLAFKTNKRLTANQIVHIWVFTIAFQQTFDLMVEFKYHGYWYFGKEIDWKGLLPHTVLIPPVNMMFLNWYPFRAKIMKQFTYILLWEVVFLVYETATLLPEPWGYFHYGWWKLQYAAVINPVLLLILLGYYKWICKLEKLAINR
ncbi:hypothetical protein [Peribacillus sp. SCS-155]|uniref:hypothetical protein n=1 Tax=Peribacillus sedimenti TaxID=3115297 RepID=UPI0039063A24